MPAEVRSGALQIRRGNGGFVVYVVYLSYRSLAPEFGSECDARQ
jgi:hypothetical protein